MITNFQSAQCQNCLLAKPEHQPLQSDIREGTKYTIVLDNPDDIDIDHNQCAAGRYAIDLMSALKLAGIRRSECNIVYVSACATWDMDSVRRQASSLHKEHSKLLGKIPKLYDPVTCCEPRFNDDLHRAIAIAPQVICMGDLVISAIRGGRHSADKLRGSAEQVLVSNHGLRSTDGTISKTAFKAFYTIHPRRLFGEPILKPIFRYDIAKAVRYFSGTLDWKEPDIIIPRSYDEVIFALSLLQDSKFIAYDLETDDIYTEWANIRCIGLSNEDTAIVIPIRKIDGSIIRVRTHDGIMPLLSLVKKEIQKILTNKDTHLIGHNAGNFDRKVVEANWQFTPKLQLDTMLAHLLMDNELPHRLGFLGSTLTDFTEAWKADNTANEAKSDKELWTYCGKDCVVTARVGRKVWQGMKDNNQEHLYEREAMLQDIGVRMSKLGIAVDGNARDKLLGEYSNKVIVAGGILRKEFGPNFNPRSSAHLKDALYTKFGLLPCAFSKKTKEPSTDDNAIREMMITYRLDDHRYDVLHNLRLYKSANQLMQLSLKPICTHNTPFMHSNGEKGYGILDDNNVVHPNYNRLPATGRYSSSDPNLQNINTKMRRMYVPRYGNIFIACDANALEAVLIAEESGAQHTIKVLSQGLDLHNETMEHIYGNGIWTLSGAPKDRRKKGEKDFKSSRGTIKNGRYAHNYGAGLRRIWEQVTAAEDDDGNLLYKHITMDMIEEIVTGLRELEPEIPEWWKRTQALWRQQGYIADSLWGRKRKFRRKATLPGIVNHPIQSGGFHIVAEAMIETLFGEQDWFATERCDHNPISYEVLQYNWMMNTGLVTQTHDSLMFEVREKDKDEATSVLSRVMTRRRKMGALLDYTCETKSGYSWEEV